MSMFDKYTKTEYVDTLRIFLDLGKRNFLREAGFVEEGDQPRKGRLPRYQKEPIAALENLVNEKAARCEALDTTVGERYRIARDYCGFNDSHVAREFKVTRELVRRWGLNMHPPRDMAKLAQVVHAPLEWLEHGGEEYLPANIHLGVRVGEENKLWRETLYSLTLSLLGEIPDLDDESYVRAYIEWAVFNKPELASAARKAGGRWQLVNGTLFFSPWMPIKEHGLSRRYWSDKVESIIEEALSTKSSVYGAWEEIRKRCTAMGLTADEYPKRISLHKRLEKDKLRIEQFGVDLNDLIAESVAQHPV